MVKEMTTESQDYLFFDDGVGVLSLGRYFFFVREENIIFTYVCTSCDIEKIARVAGSLLLLHAFMGFWVRIQRGSFLGSSFFGEKFSFAFRIENSFEQGLPFVPQQQASHSPFVPQLLLLTPMSAEHLHRHWRCCEYPTIINATPSSLFALVSLTTLCSLDLFDCRQCRCFSMNPQ